MDRKPAAKRSRCSKPQKASILDSAGFSSACQEDRAHLQGLDTTFAGNVNLILCAKDQERVIGFPVHKDIISAHSPVLCQIMGELTTSCSNPQQLPMVDDSCSAIRDILARIYGAFGHTSKQSVPSVACSFSSKHWSVTANTLRLCHKYAMIKLESALEESLVQPLTQYLRRWPSTQQHNMVLEIASVAEECNRNSLLVLCEAYVVKYFAYYESKPNAMSKLSSASMFRISSGLSRHHPETMRAVNKALAASVTEAKYSSRKYCGTTCPRCRETVVQLAKNADHRHIKHKHHPVSCTWPETHSFQQPSVKVVSTAAYLASLQKAVV